MSQNSKARRTELLPNCSAEMNYLESWKLKDGTSVTLRPIRPADEPLMVKFHQMLSEDSVYFRYLGMLQLSQRIAHLRLAKVCAADHEHGLALVAEHKDTSTGEIEIIGVGRLMKCDSVHEVEFALVVEDCHQAAGLGTHLLRRLIEIARQEGQTRVVGYILPSNRPMLHICEKLGFRRIHPLGDPVVRMELDLPTSSH